MKESLQMHPLSCLGVQSLMHDTEEEHINKGANKKTKRFNHCGPWFLVPLKKKWKDNLWHDWHHVGSAVPKRSSVAFVMNKNGTSSLIAGRMGGPQACVMFHHLIPGLFTWHNDVCAASLRAFRCHPLLRRRHLSEVDDDSLLVGEIIKGSGQNLLCFKRKKVAGACMVCEAPIRGSQSVSIASWW